MLLAYRPSSAHATVRPRHRRGRLHRVQLPPQLVPANPDVRFVNLDVLTYAGNRLNLRAVEDAPNYTFVTDRPGHDWRYAVDTAKIERELNWQPAHTFETGLRDTVRWYLDHPDWLDAVSPTTNAE